MRKLLTQRLTRTDIIAPDVSYDFGVCLEHLLMRAEAPTQAREVDDDHAFRHDGRPFALRLKSGHCARLFSSGLARIVR
jgi:hypothetical protein